VVRIDLFPGILLRRELNKSDRLKGMLRTKEEE